MNRRGFIGALIAAPAAVSAVQLLPKAKEAAPDVPRKTETKGHTWQAGNAHIGDSLSYYCDSEGVWISADNLHWRRTE